MKEYSQSMSRKKKLTYMIVLGIVLLIGGVNSFLVLVNLFTNVFG
jgi:hypothetical protein